MERLGPQMGVPAHVATKTTREEFLHPAEPQQHSAVKAPEPNTPT
jgi:hypothetical protein